MMMKSIEWLGMGGEGVRARELKCVKERQILELIQMGCACEELNAIIKQHTLEHELFIFWITTQSSELFPANFSLTRHVGMMMRAQQHRRCSKLLSTFLQL
jgi:hypothetical protein